MQVGHLRGYVEFEERGLDYSRLVMGSWDVPGRCDIRTLTYVINAHLQRHGTYHSWFDYKDEKNVIRHTIKNARDIRFAPKEHGVLTQPEWRDLILSTPDPLQWDCFRFGVVQHAEYFSLFAAVDHLHCDPMLIAGMYVECIMNYHALLEGKAPVALGPTGSHEGFCGREVARADAMTLESPEVRRWIEYAENNGGSLPDFPLPLGDQSIPCGGDIHVEKLLGQEERLNSRPSASGRVPGSAVVCLPARPWLNTS